MKAKLPFGMFFFTKCSANGQCPSNKTLTRALPFFQPEKLSFRAICHSQRESRFGHLLFLLAKHNGSSSHSSPRVFPDKPQAPRTIRVRDVWKDYINIYWDLPDSDGGSPITGYNIEVRDAFEISFKYVGSVDANTVHYQVSNHLCGGGGPCADVGSPRWVFSSPVTFNLGVLAPGTLTPYCQHLFRVVEVCVKLRLQRSFVIVVDLVTWIAADEPGGRPRLLRARLLGERGWTERAPGRAEARHHRQAPIW